MAFNYSPKIITDGLVLYLDAANTRSYPTTGTIWSDLSRNNNNGTLTNGPTFNSSNGGSIVFDGTNDKVIATNSTSVNLQSVLTLEMMIRPTNNTQNAGILGKWSAGNQTDNSYVFYLGQDSSINRYGFIISQSNGVLRTLSPSSTYSANIWYHFVCVADGSMMYIYQNGVVNVQTLSYDGTIRLSTRNVNIGSLREDTNLYPFNGRIAFVKIYNRALSAQEVLQNFNATKSRFGIT